MKKELKRPIILASVMLGMFLSAIEATIVATAMPSIVTELQHFSLYSWVFSAYLLASSATVLVFGKLADIYGRRPIYVLGASTFLLGSILAGSSTSMHMLIIARFIQGVGAGALTPVATTIVGDIYSKKERAKVQGYLSSVWGISAIVGPIIGAFFVDFLHWRYVFWMNIPLGIISMLGIVIFLKEDIKKEKQDIDYIGAFLLITSISTLMYILVEGGVSVAWDSSWMIGIITVCMSSFILLLFHEKKSKEPMLPSTIWTYRLIFIANATSLVTGIIMISVASYLPTFVQGVMGESAIIAGFTLTTMSIGWPIASTVAGRLLLVIGYRKTSLIGAVSLLIGTCFFILLPVIQHYIWAGFASFFIGIGMGMTSTAFIVAIQTTVEWQIRGIATAANMFMRSIGSALGVAFFGGIINKAIQKQIEQADLSEAISINAVDTLLDPANVDTLSKHVMNVLQNGLVQGMQQVYIWLGVLALLTYILIRQLPKKDDENAEEKQ